ncbi:hypothetical protein NN484_04705 [Pseudomonas serboccidentalis]|uniref:Uncharacterized protein n=1 Tax=Pseudomonas serboccidentalis TaxID=2964670 RepID=A0ABY7ZBH1_9PSED|nr:hypothetical protein [Pseudomonas serboccidentalis]WDR37035.1 hypothetical protein NN484_04705 [Pseudomonas serboccidentalis]
MKKRGLQAALFFACQTAFASKLVPTLFDNGPSAGMQSPVGASLLAKRPVQAAQNLDLYPVSCPALSPFNLSLTTMLKTLDRISRYFKANFSALIR